MEEIRQIALIYFSRANAPASPSKQIRIDKIVLYKKMAEIVSAFIHKILPNNRLQIIMQVWSHCTQVSKINKQLKKISTKARKDKLNILHDELFLAWRNKDAAHMWTISKILAGKSALRAKSLVRLSGPEWQQGLVRLVLKVGSLPSPLITGPAGPTSLTLLLISVMFTLTYNAKIDLTCNLCLLTIACISPVIGISTSSAVDFSSITMSHHL